MNRSLRRVLCCVVTILVCNVCTLLAGDPVSSAQAIVWGGNSTELSGIAVWTNAANAVHGNVNTTWGLGLLVDGSIITWGADTFDQTTDKPIGSNYTYVNAGWTHGIAIDGSGTVVEWGEPNAGAWALDDWTNLRPAALIAKTATKVAAGDNHSLALSSDGHVYVWGGRASATNYADTWSNVVDISSTWYSWMALLDDGTVRCVGEALGSDVGAVTPPQVLTNGTKTVTYIATSPSYFAAVDSLGQGYIWGWDGATTPTYAITNINQTELTNLAAIAVGRWHVIGLHPDGTVSAWGTNDYNQLDVPETATNIGYIASFYTLNLGIEKAPTATSTNRLRTTTIRAGNVTGP